MWVVVFSQLQSSLEVLHANQSLACPLVNLTCLATLAAVQPYNVFLEEPFLFLPYLTVKILLVPAYQKALGTNGTQLSEQIIYVAS